MVATLWGAPHKRKVCIGPKSRVFSKNTGEILQETLVCQFQGNKKRKKREMYCIQDTSEKRYIVYKEKTVYKEKEEKYAVYL